MVKSQRLFSTIIITLLPFLSVSSIATVNCRPTTLSRRVLSANCDPLFGGCNDQWPYFPITSSNPFISRPLLRHPTPPVVPLPPSMITNPSFSPLVASPPPPPHDDVLPPVLPELPPTDYTNAAPPFDALSFSPPADDNLRPPETILPPPVDANPPPQQNLPAPDLFNVPAPPLVPVDSQPQDHTQFPQDLPFTFTPATPSTIGQPEDIIMPPAVDRNGKTEPQLPPMVASPPDD